jgi:glycine/D-amino acid oxidase-like deaminating enzyme
VTTTPLWLVDAAPPRASLASDLEVDVCVVGAGIGGLSTAWHLCGQGLRVVVIEARTAGGGASGRNGGFLLAGASSFHHDLRARIGHAAARRLYRLTLDAQQELYRLADRIGAGSHLRRQGGLRLAADAHEAQDVRALAGALAEDGFPAELVDTADLPPVLRAEGRIGLRTPHDGGMQPARWIGALAAAVERRGVTIHERTPVAAPVVDDRGHAVVATRHGRVHARSVVIAADGALPALVPAFADRVRARRLHMVATAPTEPVLGPETVYTRWGYEYLQQMPDGRIALGGFSDLDGEASYTDREEAAPHVHARLERWLREEIGVPAPVTHRWVGVVGYSVDDLPWVGRVPGVDDLFVLGGYSGTGNVVGFLAGRIVGELILHGASPDADLFDAGRRPAAHRADAGAVSDHEPPTGPPEASRQGTPDRSSSSSFR